MRSPYNYLWPYIIKCGQSPTELVEELREPEPESVVAELDGEVDVEHEPHHPPRPAAEDLAQVVGRLADHLGARPTAELSKQR